MVNRLLPERMDNTYRGSRLGLWLFGMVVFVTLSQSLVSIVNAHSTLRTADGIPLETYTPAAAQTVVALFALLGFAHLVIELLCVLVLVRYRSAVPLLFSVLLLVRLGGRLILWFNPIARVGTPPGIVVNLVLLGLMAVGLALSLLRREGGATPSRPTGAT